MGITMRALGGLALVSPQYALEFLAVGFGGAHAAFGLYIASRHGG